MSTIKHLFLFLLLSAAFSTGSSAQAIADSAFVNSAGNAALRSRAYEEALRGLKNAPKGADSFFVRYKQGLALQGLKKYPQALTCFIGVAGGSPLLAPLAYASIGEVQAALGRPDDALLALRAAQLFALPQTFLDSLQRKIRTIASVTPESLGVFIGLNSDSARLQAASKHAGIKNDSLALSAAINQNNVALLDGMFAHAACDSCMDCGQVDAAVKIMHDDARLSARGARALAEAAYGCRLYERAESILVNLTRRTKAADSIGLGRVYYLLGMINFKQQEYKPALAWFFKYQKRSALTPDMMLTVARIYRRMNMDSTAYGWYDKIMQSYPKWSSAPEVLWYMAWYNQSKGKEKLALSQYKKLYTAYKTSPRIEDAYLRWGFCSYKIGKYNDALLQFRGYRKKYPKATFTLTADFWQAKTLYAMQDAERAIPLLNTLAQSAPGDYYAFRARRLLELLGDSLARFTPDTTCELTAARVWLDSIAQNVQDLSARDSADLVRGAFLISIGATRVGQYFLENVLTRNQNNLVTVLDGALLYLRCDQFYNANRLARRLALRIPSSKRATMPGVLTALVYPRFYNDQIVENGQRWDVAPALIQGIIRQESVFNPTALSVAGAIGLMQIMPATGRQIARGMDETYTPDSLYKADFNIRFGARYVRTLLDQFQGSLILSLASYNGGPNNAEQWYALNKEDDEDMFVENIAFSETREYVKRVLANYWMYQLLDKNPDCLIK